MPIYCPAFGDSVHGLAVAEGRLRSGKRIIFDVIGDVLEMVAPLADGEQERRHLRRRRHAEELHPAVRRRRLPLRPRSPPGHSYGIQITMDQPQWGGLSGCTFEEAVSWRKIAPDARFVTVNVEATVALPLIVSALAEKKAHEGRSSCARLGVAEGAAHT